MKETIKLKDVPETMLWPLWNRAGEQLRADRVLVDPLSAQLVSRIDYDFERSFGKPQASHAIRARVADDLIKNWLQGHPDGIIVALGEGLESQFWRVDNGRMRWISVDLPESTAVREHFLPKEDRITTVSRSVLDFAWMEAVPRGAPVFVSIAGLLMYFEEKDVTRLLRAIADRFPSSELFFDMVPVWFAQKSIKGLYVTKHYKLPPTPWGVNFENYNKVLDIHPSFRLRRKLNYVEAFPKRMRLWSYVSWLPVFKNKITPWMLHLEVSR